MAWDSLPCTAALSYGWVLYQLSWPIYYSHAIAPLAYFDLFHSGLTIFTSELHIWSSPALTENCRLTLSNYSAVTFRYLATYGPLSGSKHVGRKYLAREQSSPSLRFYFPIRNNEFEP